MSHRYHLIYMIYKFVFLKNDLYKSKFSHKWNPNFLWMQVGGIYVRLFLKDPKFPLRNPKRFLEGLLDQYLSSIAATHYETQVVDPELPLLLSAALVSLLRVHPALADHVGYLGYVPKLVAAVAFEGRRETMSSGEINNGKQAEQTYDLDNESPENTQTPQERVRLSCLRVLHQLAASTTCAEAMAATSVGTPQVHALYDEPVNLQFYIPLYSGYPMYAFSGSFFGLGPAEENGLLSSLPFIAKKKKYETYHTYLLSTTLACLS